MVQESENSDQARLDQLDKILTKLDGLLKFGRFYFLVSIASVVLQLIFLLTGSKTRSDTPSSIFLYGGVISYIVLRSVRGFIEQEAKSLRYHLRFDKSDTELK